MKYFVVFKLMYLSLHGKVMERKLRMFGHIPRMEDNTAIKNVMLGVMNGTGRRGRPAREWMDDII